MYVYLKGRSKIAKFEINKSEQSYYEISIDRRVYFVFGVPSNRNSWRTGRGEKKRGGRMQ